MKTIERTISSLCQEIDELKEVAEYWRLKYEQEREMNNTILNQNLADSQKGVANALMFALKVKDDENGNLIISKEDRAALANNMSPLTT